MFRPQGLHLISAIPSTEYCGRSLTPDCVFSSQELSQIKDELLNCSTVGHRFAIIEAFLFGKFNRDLVDERVDFAVEAIHSGHWDLDTLSETVCLSTRRFRELFSSQTGFSPAYFNKIFILFFTSFKYGASF